MSVKGGIFISKKVKGVMAILFLSISFYMMLSTPYTHALGDYVLEFIGVKSWTGEYSGTHLTIFYFWPLTLLGLFFVGKYAVYGWGIRKRKILLIFIIFIAIFTSANNAIVRTIKNNSNGLLSIGFNSKTSNMNFKAHGLGYTQFNAEIDMTNYGDSIKEFYLTINSPFYSEEGREKFDIFTKEGNRAIFTLNGNETKLFKINLDQYKIIGGKDIVEGSGGIIQEVILTDLSGNSVRLEDNNFFGVEINR